jgi:predicted 3-demethylubiquinone-9 3-methyltransferase (glyoxalase superfamily)
VNPGDTLGDDTGKEVDMATTFSMIVPCIWLDDQAEQAAGFYARAFPAGRVIAASRYPAHVDNPGGRPRGSVLAVEFEISGQRFTALNGGPLFVLNPSISFFVHFDSPGDVDPLVAALADGGEALMPLDRYPWSERYGWIRDRFGVSWQVMAGRRSPQGATISPCLMFSGAVSGRAEGKPAAEIRERRLTDPAVQGLALIFI